jgi:hypothetical protein
MYLRTYIMSITSILNLITDDFKNIYIDTYVCGLVFIFVFILFLRNLVCKWVSR